MKFLSNLFGHKVPHSQKTNVGTSTQSPQPRIGGRDNSQTRTTTADNPYCIENPVIGFLNLQGTLGASLLELDRQVLSPLFASAHVSSGVAPKCQVLFIYCTVDGSGRIEGSDSSIRTLIKDAGAYIAVVATENDPNGYMKAMSGSNDWSANIVLVMDRKGEKFAAFFRELFKAMFQAQSMPMAWVELAPQIPGRDHPDAPSTIMAVEAGHLTFKAVG